MDAVSRVNARLSDDSQHLDITQDLEQFPSQKVISDRLAAAAHKQLRSQAPSFHSARLNAFSAPGAGRWLFGLPSRAPDKNRSSTEVATAVATHLGVDVHEGGAMCSYCPMVLDTKGIHPQSCMAGGDENILHNAIRDVYEDYSRRGGLRPEREAPRQMADTNAEQPSQERLADILIITRAAKWQ